MENFRLPIELHQAHTQYPWEIRQTTSRYLLQAEQSASIGLSGITQPDSGFPSLTMPVIEYTLGPCRFNNPRLCRTYCFLIHLMSSIRLTYSDCKKCALCTCSVWMHVQKENVIYPSDSMKSPSNHRAEIFLGEETFSSPSSGMLGISSRTASLRNSTNYLSALLLSSTFTTEHLFFTNCHP